MGKLSKELRMGIHNRFDIEVVDVETGEVKQKAQAFNVVCNKYYELIFKIMNGDLGSPNITIAYGDGEGTPAATDTALFSHLGYATSNSSYSPFDVFDISKTTDGTWSRTIKRAIPYTMSVGKEISEVGVVLSGSADGGGTIYGLATHAILQDMNGNPISILHTDTDIVYVYATLYLHYDAQDSDIKLYGGENMYSSTPSHYRGLIGAGLLANGYLREIIVSGEYSLKLNSWSDLSTMSPSVGSINRSYNLTTKQFFYTSKRLDITQANVGGIAAIHLTNNTFNSNSQQANADGYSNVVIAVGGPTIPSARIVSESVGTGDGATTKYKTKFKRPYLATIYLNGTPVNSGVTIKKLGLEASTAGADLFSMTGANNFKYVRFWYPDMKMQRAWSDPYSTAIRTEFVTEVLDPETGIYLIAAGDGKIKGSNDGITWVDVETNTSSAQMNQAGAHYKYYKSTDGNYKAYINAYDGYNIIFDNPPAQGDVITIDYTTDYIPKDSDHVLDVELTFTFGEWTGE